MRPADLVAAGEGAPAAAADSPWAALRQTPLDAGLWLALARDYQRHELPWQAACAARQGLRRDPGVRAQLDALALGDRHDPATGDARLGPPRLAPAAAKLGSSVDAPLAAADRATRSDAPLADIALEPTPYNGGTTTLQALWMGVPVVPLAGENFVGRTGASFLASSGQHDRIATDAAACVAIAARLAAEAAPPFSQPVTPEPR
ncbi:MAG: hypothetical protein V5B60_20715 [Accumulibacter sp.]|jgi:hypothetical protein|uniref:O-linked N-acetylglucosamine transferase family protein n=1 Tax=Accumulibacter sp. TaxID=2053492 RepID=UPI002FC27BDE